MFKSDRYAYDVALSFAGEQRSYVKRVYNALNKKGLKVFYDKSPDVQAAHLGKRFSEVAQRVYGESAEFAVIFASKEYVSKQWPYFESAHLLDRMRAELFQGNKIIVGKFEDVRLPGFPGDIWYANLSETPAATFAKIIADAIASRKSIDQDAILTMFAREDYSRVIASLTESLSSGVSYDDQVFALYCRACARSRKCEQDRESEPDLTMAVSDMAACLSLVQGERPHFVAKLAEFANRDDDLLALRTAL